MNRDERRTIMKSLYNNLFFSLGEYSRIFPDAPDCTTKGEFQLQIDLRVWLDTGAFSYATFDIRAVEVVTKTYTQELDCEKYSFWIKETHSQKAFWDQIRAFLDKFDSKEALYKFVTSKFGFNQQKALLSTFHMLESELPDGTSFEDFLEGVI